LAAIFLGFSAQAGWSGDAVTSAADDASDKADPFISIEGTAEMQFDAAFSKPSRTTALFSTIEPEVTVNLSPNFHLFTHLVFEPVNDPIEGKNNVFHAQGLYAEEAYANLIFEDYGLKLGKIDPVFGYASDAAPGIYGQDFPSGYDVKGALGVIGSWANDAGDGDQAVRQSVDASIFTADPSVLSESLFTNRGLFDWQDDRVGNTAGPESLALAYTYMTHDGDDNPTGPVLRLALRRLAARSSGIPDEWSYLASGQTVFDIGEDQTLSPIAEAAFFQNEDGYSRNGAIITSGMEYKNGPWIASLVAALHKSFGSALPTDTMVTTSFGRTFTTAGIGDYRVELAWRYGHEDNVNTQMIGVRFHKDFEWASGGE
jgi:hypothetical protein